MADYPPRYRWALAVGAPILAARRLELDHLGGWDREGIARARGEDEIGEACRSYLADYGLTDRATLMAWARGRLHGQEPRAHAMAELVAAVGWSVWAGWLSDDDGFHVIMLAGKLVQQAYGSWDDVIAAYEAAAGAGVEAAARSLWATLPWELDLEVQLFDPNAASQRVLRSTCPTCGAPRTRPSPSAYVYCDSCAQLMDYDFALAAPAQPGPVYEALAAEAAGELEHWIDRWDREQYRRVKQRVLAAWVDACPPAVPVRVKDPAYSERYIAWLVEADVVAAFDAAASAAERAMKQAVEKLVFLDVGGRPRVAPEPFAAFVDAMFAYEARRDALFDPDIYALHPDGASRELQRRIGMAMFVQGWLPMLDDASATALLDRTGLRREYVALPPAATRSLPCDHCGGALAIVDGAKRVVCEHCGRLVTVTAP